MVAKDRKKASNFSEVKVGEIDTSAPFQSVRDAVTKFGEAAMSAEKSAIAKPKPHSAEGIWAKGTQLHLAQKELSRLKEQIKNVGATKVEAVEELQKAKRMAEDLKKQLETVTEARESAIKARNAAKHQAEKLEEAECGKSDGLDASRKNDLEATRKQYMTVISELNSAKQELMKIRQDCDAKLEVRVAALKQAADAEDVAKENMYRAGELSKEILAAQESIGEVKLAPLQAQHEQAKIFAEKDVLRKEYKASLEESAKKLTALRKEFDPEVTQNLEAQLTQTMNEVGALHKEIEKAKVSYLDSAKIVTLELDDAKETLQKIAEEESSLRNLMEGLKSELENVKKEHYELKEKEAETESVAGKLQVKLQKCKDELKLFFAEESKVRGASDELLSTLKHLSSETDNARQEAEEMTRKAEELKKEAEATKMSLDEAEERLKVSLEEVEEAKAAEARALDQIKFLSEQTSAARASTSESGAKITITKEEFESLSCKVEESDKLADMKVAAAMAQLEAVKASEIEALTRLEITQKEIEDMKAATEEALRKAEMADAARRAVEGELRRWREREQKKAAEAASRILAETQMSPQPPPPHYRVPRHNPLEKIINTQKLEKTKTSVSKKVLMHNLSGMFQKKKNQIEIAFPSYLPGENPV